MKSLFVHLTCDNPQCPANSNTKFPGDRPLTPEENTEALRWVNVNFGNGETAQYCRNTCASVGLKLRAEATSPITLTDSEVRPANA